MGLIKRFFFGVVLWGVACAIAYIVGASQVLLPVIPAPSMLTQDTLLNTALFSFIGTMLLVFYDGRRGRQKWEVDDHERET